MIDKYPELARTLVKRSLLTRTPPQSPFILASGVEAWTFLDCSRTTYYGPAQMDLGRAVSDQLLPDVRAFGGLTQGADPLATVTSFYQCWENYQQHRSAFQAFSVRKEEHPTEGWITGCVSPGDYVAVLEDVITSGQSAEKAIIRCQSEGLQVLQVIALVDRQVGGVQYLEDKFQIPIIRIFKYDDLLNLPKSR